MGLDHGISIRKRGRGKSKYKSVLDMRKCNQIHGWFLRNCIFREYDDPREWNGDYFQIFKQDIIDLYNDINYVLDNSELVDGRVQVCKIPKRFLFWTYWRAEYEPGKVIKNPKVAKEVLPTTDGFYFGRLEYDGLYYEQLEYVKKGLEKLKDIDEEEYAIYYWGWW